MLKLILALLPLTAMLVGQSRGGQARPVPPPTTKATAKVPPANVAPAPPTGGIQGIPAGAVKLDDNTYRFQEKDGKVWLFRRNPFGVSKIEETEAAKMGLPSAAAPPPLPATAVDLGDSYRFERPGPFGAKIWIKKKNDLTEEERAIANGRSKLVTSSQKAVN